MIAKTTVGNNFEGALTYGAGLRTSRKLEKVELLEVANVREGTPQQMAKEMREVAGLSARIRKPVWHTALSWAPGEVVSREQKLAAAARYCELIGAPMEAHQVVVYEHNDKPHAHIHIYLNRVPLAGGAALRTDNNFYRQPGICKAICQELGMRQLPSRRRSLRDVDPTKERARLTVKTGVEQTLARIGPTSGLAWLTEQLAKLAITIRYKHDKSGILRGVSFGLGEQKLTGQEVGYKGADLRAVFTRLQVQQAQVQQAQQSAPPALAPERPDVTPTAPTPVGPALPVPAPLPAPTPKRRGPKLS